MFRKKSYSDREVEEILHSLFQEKKKVHELELKVKNYSLSPSVPALEESENKALELKSALDESLRMNSQLKDMIEITEKEEASTKRQLLDLTHKLKSSEEEVQALYNQLGSLKTQVAKDTNQSQMVWEEKYVSLTQENLSFSKRLNAYEQTIKRLESDTLDFQTESESLRAHLVNAEEEISSLRKQLALSKEQAKKIHLEENSLKSKERDLASKLEESEEEKQTILIKVSSLNDHIFKLEKTLEVSKEEKRKILEELKSVKEEKDEIYHEEKALEEQILFVRDALNQSEKKVTSLKEENEILRSKDKETHDQLIHYHKEIEVLKQMMMKTLQEFKDERHKEEHAYQQTIHSLQLELNQAKTVLETLEQEKNQSTVALTSQTTLFAQLQNELIATTEKANILESSHSDLTKLVEDLKQKLAKSEEAKKLSLENMQKKEELIEKLQSELSELQRAIFEKDEIIQQAAADGSEHESRLRVAQQHLAKKVREATLLAEKNDELKGKIVELEMFLEGAKAKSYELQGTLEAELQLQKKREQQHLENLKNMESQSHRWEEKYFQMHEKWQEVDARNRELKKLEERFSKLHQVITHLGHVVGSPMPFTTIEMSETPIPQEAIHIDFQKPQTVTTPGQPTLFESKSTPRLKESLFG